MQFGSKKRLYFGQPGEPVWVEIISQRWCHQGCFGPQQKFVLLKEKGWCVEPTPENSIVCMIVQWFVVRKTHSFQQLQKCRQCEERRADSTENKKTKKTIPNDRGMSICFGVCLFHFGMYFVLSFVSYLICVLQRKNRKTFHFLLLQKNMGADFLNHIGNKSWELIFGGTQNIGFSWTKEQALPNAWHVHGQPENSRCCRWIEECRILA